MTSIGSPNPVTYWSGFGVRSDIPIIISGPPVQRWTDPTQAESLLESYFLWSPSSQKPKRYRVHFTHSMTSPNCKPTHSREVSPRHFLKSCLDTMPLNGCTLNNRDSRGTVGLPHWRNIAKGRATVTRQIRSVRMITRHEFSSRNSNVDPTNGATRSVEQLKLPVSNEGLEQS